MRKIFTSALAATILLNFEIPLAASADSTSVSDHVAISEVQTASASSASQEFIELYNPTPAPVPLAGWTISYKAATSADTSWTKHATLSGTIPADGFYLIAPKSYLSSADTDWSATLAGTGGNIRLSNATGQVVDSLGYGDTANAAESAPATAPAAGQSIERLPGWLNPFAGNGVDTDNNSADFIVQATPEPQSTVSPIELPDTSISSDDGDDTTAPVDDTGDAPAPPVSYAPITISELLPNPMAPLTDAHDEYIELYNSTADDVNLQGYALRAGSNFHEYYVLPSVVVPAGGYVALYSSQTKLTLPNTGGAVALLDPTGAIINQTPAYAKAPDGEAWAAFGSGWAWTLQLTPGHANVLAALAGVSVLKSPKAVKASTKKVATPKKKAATKAAKPKAKKKAKKVKAATQPLPAATAASLLPAGRLIAVLSVLTVGYALYEFREDLQRYYRRLRRDPEARSGDRPESPGRRGD